MSRGPAYLARGLVVALLGLGAASAANPGASEWASSGHAQARLLGAGRSPGAGPERAGVEIRLDPGFITYWRDPGEAGLPPRFDFGASVNVAGVAADYPAPQRLDEGGADAFGYAEDVIFPLRVTRADPDRPAVLALRLDYAVCEKLCLPASASLRLDLPGAPQPEAAALIEAALARVPRPVGVGAPGPLAVTGVAAVAADGLDVLARSGPEAALFVEAPEGWFLQPDAPVPSGGGGTRFHLAVLQRPEGAVLAGLALRLTLVAGRAAIEVPLRVDAGAPRP